MTEAKKTESNDSTLHKIAMVVIPSLLTLALVQGFSIGSDVKILMGQYEQVSKDISKLEERSDDRWTRTNMEAYMIRQEARHDKIVERLRLLESPRKGK